jgi:hypothetical protein
MPVLQGALGLDPRLRDHALDRSRRDSRFDISRFATGRLSRLHGVYSYCSCMCGRFASALLPPRILGALLRASLVGAVVAATFCIGVCSAFEWDEPVNVHPQEEVDDLFPRVANGPDGVPWMFWLGFDPIEQDREIYYSRWNGVGWALAGTVNPPNQHWELPPQVSTSRDGGLWVLWTAPNSALPGAYLGLTSSWMGNGWTVPDTLWREGARHEGWSVAAASRTEAWFVRDGASRIGSSDIFVYHYNAGVLDPEFQFVQPDSNEVYPTVTIDGAGEPWVAWKQQSPSGTGSPIQYSRRVGGSWAQPQRLSEPTSPIAPKLTTDSTGAPWIITLADAPFWPTAAEAWAIRRGASGWEAPIRLNDPVLPPFTIHYQLSVSDEPGTHPVVVWVSSYAFSVTRADLLSCRWTGNRWTAAELVGSLADSAIITWPDVARSDGAIWAAYNRGVGNRTFVQNVFAIRETPPENFPDSVEFSAEVNRGGVLLGWSMDSQRNVLSFRILRRLEGADTVPVTPVAAFPGHRSRRGSYLDRGLPAPGRYRYWMEFVISPGETLTVAPRTVDVAPRTSKGRIQWAVPNSRAGSVTIGGTAGPGAKQRLMIFDVNGRRVRVLEVGTNVASSGGRFEITWDGRTESGTRAPAGVYFAQLTNHGGGRTDRQKLILLK